MTVEPSNRLTAQLTLNLHGHTMHICMHSKKNKGSFTLRAVPRNIWRIYQESFDYSGISRRFLPRDIVRRCVRLGQSRWVFRQRIYEYVYCRQQKTRIAMYLEFPRFFGCTDTTPHVKSLVFRHLDYRPLYNNYTSENTSLRRTQKRWRRWIQSLSFSIYLLPSPSLISCDKIPVQTAISQSSSSILNQYLHIVIINLHLWLSAVQRDTARRHKNPFLSGHRAQSEWSLSLKPPSLTLLLHKWLAYDSSTRTTSKPTYTTSIAELKFWLADHQWKWKTKNWKCTRNRSWL